MAKPLSTAGETLQPPRHRSLCGLHAAPMPEPSERMAVMEGVMERSEKKPRLSWGVEALGLGQ